MPLSRDHTDKSRSAYVSTSQADQSGNPSPDALQREYVRNKILHQHLEKALRQASAPTTSQISQGLALSATLRSQASVHDEDVRTAGGLSPHDLTKITPVSVPTLRPAFLQVVEAELRKTLLAIADYYSPDNDKGDDDDGRLQSASQIPEHIRQKQAVLTQQRAALDEHRAHVLQLVKEINAAKPALESQLVTALETLPPHLRATRTAQADVLGATIEAALLKLSLIRARAHRALYGFSISPAPSTKNKDKAALSAVSASAPIHQSSAKSVADAVAAAHSALLARERAQDAEMHALDGQIAAYEDMLGLVEGGRGREGAFAQVVRDMARVKRETEECRRDLRRLGWTGD